MKRKFIEQEAFPSPSKKQKIQVEKKSMFEIYFVLFILYIVFGFYYHNLICHY